MNFDDDVESFDDFLANDEPELSDPKYRFKEQVRDLIKKHNCTKAEAEEVITTVIYTKYSDKRCKCGEVAQFVVRGEIYCYDCHPDNHDGVIRL